MPEAPLIMNPPKSSGSYATDKATIVKDNLVPRGPNQETFIRPIDVSTGTVNFNFNPSSTFPQTLKDADISGIEWIGGIRH